MNPQQQQPNSSYYYRPQAQHPSSSIHIPTPSPPNVPSSSSRIVPSLNTQLITHYQAYESLETDSSVDVCPVKDDHIWMIDNLVTIEEAEQLIDIYQDISRRKAEVASSSASSKLPRKGPSSNDILANTTVPASPASSIMSNTNTVPTFHNYMMNNNENGINFENRVQHIEYTNEEFANFIFEQLKDVLPPNQSKVFGEKIGRTFELSCINETFSIYELRPGEKIDKSKGEDKCRIIEVEKRYHEKSFLTCVICLKGVVNTAQNESNQRLFGINLYDMSKERPEHFVVLDHVGKSCLFSDNAQLFEVIENFGTENIYLLVVNVMYRSKISSNQPLSSKSSDATCTLEQDSQNGVLNVTEENQQTQQFSGYTNDPYGDEHYLELESQKKKKKSNVSKYVLLAFGTGMVVLTSLFIQGGRVNKPIVAKLLSIISKHLNI
uniref:Putative Naegleria-specific protein n=1 Tax=Naegleria fowleri TaxID=5763 RepID=M1H5U6_NAEFO|nr:putative Naegleria-specific protein [Naegleria fowleri]